LEGQEEEDKTLAKYQGPLANDVGSPSAKSSATVASPEVASSSSQSSTRKDLALITAAHAGNHLQGSTYSFLYPYIMNSLNFGYAELGALIFATGVIQGLLQGMHGWFSKWVKRRSLLGGGNAFVGLSMILSSLTHSFPLFGAARIAGGIGASPQHPLAASLMSDWYGKKKRGTTFSIHVSGGNVGTLVAPLAAGFLYITLGWRDALMILAIPALVFGALVWTSLNDQRKAGTWFNKEEQERSSNKKKSYLAAIHNREVVKLMLARSITSIGRGLGIIMTYMNLYFVHQLGLDSLTAAALIAVLSAGSVFSPIMGGRLADRLGMRRPIIIGSLVLTALALLLLVRSGPHLPLIAISVLLLGIGAFNEGSLSQALLSETVQADDERDGAFSLYFITSWAGGSLWSLVIALIIAHWSFVAAFAVIAIGNLLACLVYYLVKESKM
jgi:MFS family permease